tara:strand:- start:5140 stop:5409 length:270 start_codon:yes stop_codon:yes gene_type:complete
MKEKDAIYATVVLIILLIASTLGAIAQDTTVVKYQRVIQYQQAIDPEAIILIEDMIEYAQWDIQEGVIEPHIGSLLIANLNDLKAKLEN